MTKREAETVAHILGGKARSRGSTASDDFIVMLKSHDDRVIVLWNDRIEYYDSVDDLLKDRWPSRTIGWKRDES
jgi:hypothetical protein